MYPTWTDIDNVQDGTDFTCESIGWLLPKEHKPGWHVLIQSRTHEGLVDSGLAVPDGMVLEVTVLSPKKSK